MSWLNYEQSFLEQAGSPSAPGWGHEAFDRVKRLIEEEERFIKNPIEIEEGVMPCHRCKSSRTYSYQKQVRRADEGFTTFCSCFECGSQWTEN